MAQLICQPVLDNARHKYSVQPGLGFLAPGYYAARRMCHTGTDYNATSGGDSDLGDAVYAAADGVIVDVGFYRGWGWIVLIHHPALGVWTQYAHLSKVLVAEGRTILAGTQLGAIGKGDPAAPFWAHLHFEVRRVLLPSWEWPSNTYKNRAQCEAYIRARYLDAEVWLRSQRALTRLADVQAAIAARAKAGK